MTVKTFTNAKEMFEHVRQQRTSADAQTEDWQRSVLPGARIIRVAEAAGKLLLIYGEIIDILESERAHYDLDDPIEAAEFEYVERRYSKEWARSFRYGRFYSPLCHDGEFGQIHLATITGVLTEAEFEEARKQDWPQDFDFARTVVLRRARN